jgi:ubiquinone/menaquinone biosynthesis C-methylase UbiE
MSVWKASGSEGGSVPPVFGEKTGSYVLGHSQRELDRLRSQAQLVAPFTRQLLLDAGIVRGMRVLDVGSGAGDVAFLAGELVGRTGEVIGTDVSAAAIAAATEAARARSAANVGFVKADPTDMFFEKPFDAVIGRYVLLFAADRGGTLARLLRHLRPGGVVAFHEPDWSFVRSVPGASTYDRCCQWIVETWRLAGTPNDMADQLHAAFLAAGLPAPVMRMQTHIGAGDGIEWWLEAVADLVASLLPAMERFGITTATEADVATLANRLSNEVKSTTSVIIGRAEVGAWSRL